MDQDDLLPEDLPLAEPIDTVDPRKVPRSVLAFGGAGLIPPVATAGALIALPAEPARDIAWIVLVFYGQAILSFLGGTWWTFAARAPRAGLLALAIAPSLIAVALLLAMLSPALRMPATALLALAIAATPLADRALGALTPTWWMRLRVPLSIGLALCVAVAAWRTPGG